MVAPRSWSGELAVRTCCCLVRSDGMVAAAEEEEDERGKSLETLEVKVRGVKICRYGRGSSSSIG